MMSTPIAHYILIITVFRRKATSAAELVVRTSSTFISACIKVIITMIITTVPLIVTALHLIVTALHLVVSSAVVVIPIIAIPIILSERNAS
ncbi:hypothetical protein ACXX82_22425 [Glaciimonas sp. GNP009]